ncbi:MAG: hypothetical protein ABF703_07970 [Oenococcus sp.]|uniref:hypothetical protein n=1 Tax=Oenococcus TaxID=46254 RepID=UPI0021E70402|nr:hypothetical protein [Oenococcus kitaharae]MCV3295838.1 hypothetical protein [Oenococcus kitaharae]
MTKTGQRQFIAYEYRELIVDDYLRDFYADAYPNFGWELKITDSLANKPHKVRFNMKRNRQLLNQSELKRLQNQFESQMAVIKQIERKARLLPTIQACLIGLFGLFFMIMAIFLARQDHWVFVTVLGLLGLAGLCLPMYWFKRQFQRAEKQNQLSLDQRYDFIYDICQKAHALSHFN